MSGFDATLFQRAFNVKFQNGNKLAKGGRRQRAGRPKKEEATVRLLVREAVERELQSRAATLAKQYVDRALGEKGDRVLMHAIDRAVPAAKQEVEISGGLKIVRVNAFDPDAK